MHQSVRQLNSAQIETAFNYLSQRSYWSKGISKSCFKRACDNSLCFAIINTTNSELIAFARVITDKATFANLSDVFVIEQYRKKGYSKQLMQHIMSDENLQGLRRFTLATKDAHDLYRYFNFTEQKTPENMMEYYQPCIYSEQRIKS